jgi:hypothetical protein
MFLALECAPEFKHIVKFDWQSLFVAVIQEAAFTPLCTSEIRRAVLESKSTAKVTVCVSDHNLIGKLQRIGVGSSVIVVRNAGIICIFGELPTLALNVPGHQHSFRSTIPASARRHGNHKVHQGHKEQSIIFYPPEVHYSKAVATRGTECSARNIQPAAGSGSRQP